MENDTSFADLDHFNVVSEKFGIHFNSVLRKHVIGTNWEQGKIAIDGNGPIFHHPHTIYVKDVCTISVSGPARAVLDEGDDIFMATAKYGKGTVFAMTDPWLYNEYTDGRKLPPPTTTTPPARNSSAGFSSRFRALKQGMAVPTVRAFLPRMTAPHFPSCVS